MVDSENFKDDNEKIFRAVRPNPLYWSSQNKVTDAAFSLRENENGISFTRGKNRDDKEVCESMHRNFTGNIVSLTVKICKGIDGINLIYTPSKANIFHSEIIFQTDDRMQIFKIKHKLAKNAFVEPY